MAKLTLNNISGGYGSTTELNNNFDLIETALENTMSRDGTTQNTMSSDFDMNSNSILNGGVVYVTALQINGVSVVPGDTLTVDTAANVPFEAAGDIVAEDVQAAIEELDTEKATIASVTDLATETAMSSYYHTHENTVPDLTVVVDAGNLVRYNTRVSNNAQSVVITAAHATLDRIDRVVVNKITGVATVETGTAAGTPVAPVIPATSLPVCQVSVPATDTTITDSQITDERSAFNIQTQDYLKYTEQQTTTVAAGPASATTWNTRVFTNEDNDDGGWGSLSAGAITLAIGTYRVKARANAFDVEAHRLRLYDNTATAAIMYGDCVVADATNNVSSTAFLSGEFAITVASELELEHWTAAAKPTNGLGLPSSSGTNEIYATLELWKIA